LKSRDGWVSVSVMPYGSGKRKLCAAEPDVLLPVSMAQTPKEHMWDMLTSIIWKHSTVSLVGKSGSDTAMKWFQCVYFSFFQVLVTSMLSDAKSR
jgi:hypothetical protein